MSDNDNEYDEGRDPLADIKQKEIDDMIFDEAISNSYKLLLKEITLDDMIETKFDENLTAILAYNPEQGPLLTELETMINYYVEREEYDRCVKLRDLMYENFPDSKLTE
jgi:hypothetical protein|tara:strand:+ start:4167 stop:4493 length:327 start_codon:yes stop_codon:yes gene_type:complete